MKKTVQSANANSESCAEDVVDRLNEPRLARKRIVGRYEHRVMRRLLFLVLIAGLIMLAGLMFTYKNQAPERGLTTKSGSSRQHPIRFDKQTSASKEPPHAALRRASSAVAIHSSSLSFGLQY